VAAPLTEVQVRVTFPALSGVAVSVVGALLPEQDWALTAGEELAESQEGNPS
jgi:hypothetical protein